MYITLNTQVPSQRQISRYVELNVSAVWTTLLRHVQNITVQHLMKKTTTAMSYRRCDITTAVPFHHTEALEQAKCDPVHPPCD